MINSDLDALKVEKIRKAFRASIPSALLLGAVMVIWPSGFWRLIGMDVGAAPYPAILYGSVIFGVGLASIAGLRAPRQHVGVLLLLCCYKSIAVLALLTHGVLGLLADKPVPLAVWAIAVLWLLQAVSNARLYPWGIED